MLQALLAGLLTASVVSAIVALNEFVSPAQALDRLSPVVVGTLDLTSSPASATFSVSNMSPGDVAVRSLTLTNGGTLPFRYAMLTAVDEDVSGLASRLEVAVREAVDEGCDSDAGAAIAGYAPLAAIAFGSPDWGVQEGDRRLDPEGSEVLCFFVSLPLATTNDVSAASAALTLTFAAEEIRDQ
ncbi:MAG: TasA family protein [Chloroflexi bacterium]|nr:TasA family protein [Chloroflexota bacterium]